MAKVGPAEKDMHIAKSPKAMEKKNVIMNTKKKRVIMIRTETREAQKVHGSTVQDLLGNQHTKEKGTDQWDTRQHPEGHHEDTQITVHTAELHQETAGRHMKEADHHRMQKRSMPVTNMRVVKDTKETEKQT